MQEEEKKKQPYDTQDWLTRTYSWIKIITVYMVKDDKKYEKKTASGNKKVLKATNF